uniref:Palmitoyltransferase n=1 Tax=Prolemur simus TaxID=1328070 RepID=A0A8C9B039_PROSS
CPAPSAPSGSSAHLGPAMPAPRPAPRVWFVRDALGIGCAAVAWLLVLGAAGLLLRELLLPCGDAAYAAANGALFLALATLGLAAHARTMLTDPGSVPRGDPPGSRAAPRCALCASAKPAGTHHCSVCGRCIRRRDHHCPWVNNCVGEDNQKYFVLFTLYTALASLHLLLLLGVPVLRRFARGEWTMHSTVSPGTSLFLLFMVALKGFFLASVMFVMQVYAICSGAQRLQRDEGRWGKGSKWANVKAVFGHRVSVAWISPFAPPDLQRARGHHYVV